MFKIILLFTLDQEYQPADVDQKAESWRSAVESAITTYINAHYKNGVTTVYGTSGDGNITIIACIESHAFEPKNWWYVYMSCNHSYL